MRRREFVALACGTAISLPYHALAERASKITALQYFIHPAHNQKRERDMQRFCKG
jgi:hypothetical protein